MLAYLYQNNAFIRIKSGNIFAEIAEFLLFFFTITMYLLNNLNVFSNPRFVLSIRQTKIGLFYQSTKKIFGDADSLFDYEIIYKLSKTNISNCQPCKFSPDSNGASSSDDIAIAVLFGNQIFNVVTWVRTLRSTGCKCKILFFHEPNYKKLFNQYELKALDECGVTWHQIQKSFYGSKYVFDPRTTKYLVIQNFLEAYGNYFKRVMISDVFDTVFQRDPFINVLPRKKISVSIERVQFGNHDTNMMWVQSIDKFFNKEWWNRKWVINSGFLLGPSELMLDLFHTMNQPHYFFANNTLDQGILNLIYYKNIWSKLWIDFKGQHFISAAYSLFDIKGDDKGFMHEYRFQKYTPAVLHQYDRICPIGENLNKVCPPLGVWHRYSIGRPGYHMQPCGSYTQFNNPRVL